MVSEEYQPAADLLDELLAQVRWQATLAPVLVTLGPTGRAALG